MTVSQHNDSLNTLIDRYRSLPKAAADRATLYEEIKSKIRELVYFMPQKYFGMSEEDCAEFLLLVETRIPGLIEAYDTSETSEFEVFLYPTLEKCIRGFKKNKTKKERKEESLLYSHSAYEMELAELENSTEYIAVSEAMKSYKQEENMALQRLRFIFANNEKVRERFYVYFFSHAVLMVPDEIFKFCKTFNFDYGETMKLLTIATQESVSKENDIQHAIEKRNEYFGNQLFFENELAILNYVADHSMDCEYNANILKYKEYMQNQERFIQRLNKRIPRSVLSKIFNKADGTLANYFFFTKNLLEWCIKADYIPENPSASMGVCETLLQDALQMQNTRYLNEKSSPCFHPYKHFKITQS